MMKVSEKLGGKKPMSVSPQTIRIRHRLAQWIHIHCDRAHPMGAPMLEERSTGNPYATFGEGRGYGPAYSVSLWCPFPDLRIFPITWGSCVSRRINFSR